MGDQTCIICHRQRPEHGIVHSGCRDRIRSQLVDLPRKLAALTLALVPAPAAAGDRVSTSRSGSPTGARLDVLSLTSPGSDGVSAEALAGMLQPQIRRWRTVERAIVTAVVVEPAEPVDLDHPARPRRRFPAAWTVATIGDLVEWHAEIERDEAGDPYTVIADDQIGAMPPAEWAASWAGMWQRHLGHHPTRRRPGRSSAKTTAAARWRLMQHLIHTELGPAILSRWWAVGEAWRHYAASTVTGLDTHRDRRSLDPLADEWTVRFGPTVRVPAAAPVRYLLTWLDEACDDPGDGCGIADFAGELRTVSAELARVLGEQDDTIWIGRCPAAITNLLTGETRTCGGHLWQDPYVGAVYVDGGTEPDGVRIQCPRCRTCWGPHRYELLILAQQIREQWPIDRTRRYTAAEVATITPPCCPTCGVVVTVGWRDVTGVRDQEPWWRPVHAVCPTGCTDAQKVI